MKKEEFSSRLRKNLSVLEEREIQDIVEEYEQHIDMKIKEGLTEEAAIKDFGELQELTSGILEAYHVKADYNADKKSTSFEKVREESLKATNAIGKGAGVLGKGVGTAGRWSVQQMKKLWSILIIPFLQIKAMLKNSKKKAQGRGFMGKIWLLLIGTCELLWKGIKWCLWLMWNCFWLGMAIIAGSGTLGFIFIIGILVVLLLSGYPVIGVTIFSIGGGMMSAALTCLCIALLKKNSNKKNRQSNKNHNISIEDSKEEKDWEYPEEPKEQGKQIVVNKCQEVLYRA